ncbi:MAG TPA: COX15/CtaA family protein, partial [Anaerolineales bacterium]|nr:COX15/CtaA family protein [Anaerolineales bacterium]
CNGVVMPRAAEIETLIEFTHRLTSGAALLLVLGLLVWFWRSFPKGHPARLGAWLTAIFILLEAMVGAMLVLNEWVAGDVSIGRVVSQGIHLLNTFLLLASLTLTVYWAATGHPIRLKGQGWLGAGLGIGVVLILILGVSGAITALGDTLFRVDTLAEGLAQDINPDSHFLVRLRVWHPVIAVVTGLYTIFIALLTSLFFPHKGNKRLAIALVVLFVVQLGAGLLNLVLLAPVWLQIVHLLLADLVWVTYVFMAAALLAAPAEQSQPAFVDKMAVSV